MSDDRTRKNDALKLLLVAVSNPVVQQLEAIWRESDNDDPSEGAQCMAGYISQFGPRLGIEVDHDALTDVIMQRWGQHE